MVRRHAGNVNTASRNRGDAPMERLLEQTAPRRPKPSDSLSKWALIIGAGILATSLPQIADSRLDLPLKNVLTQELHLGLKDVTDFFVFATFPWYVKPIAGLLSDTVPLFGTRRRYYLILSSVSAAIMWLLLGAVPRSYWPLFVVLVMLNVMLVIGSTVVGSSRLDKVVTPRAAWSRSAISSRAPAG